MLRRSEGSGIPQGEPQGGQKWFPDGSSLAGQPQIQRVHQASAQSTEAPTAPASPNSPLHLQLRDFLGKNLFLWISYSCMEFSFINLSNYLLNPFAIPHPQHPVEGHSKASQPCAFVLSCQVLVRKNKKENR